MQTSTKRSISWFGFFMLFFALTGLQLSGQAQESNSPSKIYMNLDGLSTDDYAALVKASRLESSFDLTQACVPVGLMEFTLTEGNNESFDASLAHIKALILEKTGKSNSNHLPDYTADTFLDACKAYRNGSN
jgi:hypothetical protein